MDGPLLPRITDRTAVGWLRDVSVRHANRIAIDDGLMRLSFAEIWVAACRLAVEVDRTAPPGRPVGVLLPNTAQYPVAWIACLISGRPAALLDSTYPMERVRSCVEITCPGAMIARHDDPAVRQVAPGAPLIAIEDAFRTHIPPDPPPVPQAGAAFIIFTSGSTGRPKGVAIGAAAALNRAATLIDSLSTAPDDAILSMVPPSALGGMLNFFEAALAGASLLKLDPRHQPISRHAGKRITMLFGTPALLRVMAQIDADGRIRQDLRCVQPIGDALLRSDLLMLRRLLPPGCAILNAYGSTEALASLQWIVPQPYDRPGARVGTGYPVPGFTCTVVGDDGAALPDGEPGELVLRSRHMALGEWRDGELAPGPFIPDPHEPGMFSHRTGDIAVRDPDGLFTVLGRRDRQVKIRGNRIEAAEIEETLRRLDGIAEVAVAARHSGAEPELLAGIVLSDADTSQARAAVMKAVRHVLPDFMVPAHYVFVAALPLLPGGKVDLEALMALAPPPA